VDGVLKMTLIEKTEGGVLEAWGWRCEEGIRRGMKGNNPSL